MAISVPSTSTWAEATADTSGTIPGSPAAGDRMLLWVVWKDQGVTLATPSGWNLIDTFSDGSVGSGNGTGSVRQSVFYRDWQSGDAGPTLDFGAGTLLLGVFSQLLRKAGGETWGPPTMVSAAWPSGSSQTVSASASTFVPNGAYVGACIGIRDDSGTFTRAATTGIDVASGITWNGNYVEAPATHFSTTTGNDLSADAGYRLVTTGGTVTLRVTATIAASETGSIVWIVQALTQPVVTNLIASNVTAFQPAAFHLQTVVAEKITSGVPVGGNAAFKDNINTGGSGNSNSILVPINSLNRATGDLVVIACSAQVNTSVTLSAPAGWDTLDSSTHSSWRTVLASRILDGSEGSNIIFDLSATTIWTSHAVTFSIETVDPDQTPEVSADTQTADDINPPSLSPSWGSTDFWMTGIVVFAFTSSSISVNANPSGYSNLESATSGDMHTRMLTRSNTATSEDPGVFDLNNSATARVWTLGVKSDIEIVIPVYEPSVSITGGTGQARSFAVIIG